MSVANASLFMTARDINDAVLSSDIQHVLVVLIRFFSCILSLVNKCFLFGSEIREDSYAKIFGALFCLNLLSS